MTGDDEKLLTLGVESVRVALGIGLVAVSLFRRALAASASRHILDDQVDRWASPMSFITGGIRGVRETAARLDGAVIWRIPSPLQSAIRPLSPLTRRPKSLLQDAVGALQRNWRQTRISVEDSALAFARELEREVVRAGLGPLDLTDIVRTRVDIDELIKGIDLDRVLARVDIESLVDRLDLVRLTQEVLDEIDLASLVRDSTATITTDAVEEVRFASLDADRMVARVVDRLMGRAERNLNAPKATRSVDPDSSTGPAIGTNSSRPG